MMDSAARQTGPLLSVAVVGDSSFQLPSLVSRKSKHAKAPPANQRSYLDITIDPQQGYALSNLPAPFSASELRDKVVYCTNVESGQGF
ncbi:hypothetical protein HYE67_008911 [Fusarium culmorum]|uniref:Uncharacterized protein n=1 Tax=Fusarium culmorum TaxID=5516 RepID=A0A2T4H734_FUSCU|nr:hypothetical protein FCULG_00003616 [Fusarium culmorum]QPC66680.1 hypothetical protein HYE67_008911 [Fusarium culmorum]